MISLLGVVLPTSVIYNYPLSFSVGFKIPMVISFLLMNRYDTHVTVGFKLSSGDVPARIVRCVLVKDPPLHYVAITSYAIRSLV